ncbi:kinase, putative [Ricinus communis]|uniref:non-specific serine/threonine protein kinase n=1 Tax=Ricinus communis TaxID=3988 RepID=B9S707_RICCO|nr:kinase, putative [Ricinus communis]
MAFPFFNVTLSSFLFVLLFFTSAPVVNPLSTVAISETSNHTLICALRPNGDRESFLSCSGSPAGIQIPVPGLNSNISYSGVVAGDGFVCALSSFTSSISVMVCWRFSADGTSVNFKRIYEGQIIREFEREFNSSTSAAQNLSFSSIAVGDDFVCGLSGFGMISCLGNNSRVNNEAPQGNYSMIAAGSKHACALTLDNDLRCWGDTVGNIPQDKFKLLALGENRSCGLLINETVVCWGKNNFRLQESLQDTYFLHIEAKRNVFCGVMKTNRSLICWGNQNLDSNLMVFEEVLPGPCRSVCPCGILVGSVRFCSQGHICEHCYTNTVNQPPASSPPTLRPLPQPSPSGGSSGWNDKTIASLVVGCVGCCSFLLSIGFFLFKYCKCRGCRVHDSGRLDETGAPLGQDSNERVLVYEFMSNGTLHDHLHKVQDSPLMSWAARIKVALDAARGVEYLHEYAVPRIIHRDIKSSNILLDSSCTAKVSDFGLSLMGPDDEESHLSLRAAGTVGYMDPEYYRLQQLTTKSDVYSFGVVLLELLSGYKAIHKNENGVPRNVVDFVVPYIVQDEIHRVLDSRVPPPTPYEIEAVAYIGYLAADCVILEGRDRPSMSEIVNSLERALAACLMHPTSLSRSTTGSSA